MDKESRDLKQREINALEDYRQRLDREAVAPEGAMDAVRGWFGEEVERRKAMAMETKDMFDNAFRFLETTFGDSQELVKMCIRDSRRSGGSGPAPWGTPPNSPHTRSRS